MDLALAEIIIKDIQEMYLEIFRNPNKNSIIMANEYIYNIKSYGILVLENGVKIEIETNQFKGVDNKPSLIMLWPIFNEKKEIFSIDKLKEMHEQQKQVLEKIKSIKPMSFEFFETEYIRLDGVARLGELDKENPISCSDMRSMLNSLVYFTDGYKQVEKERETMLELKKVVDEQFDKSLKRNNEDKLKLFY